MTTYKPPFQLEKLRANRWARCKMIHLTIAEEAWLNLGQSITKNRIKYRRSDWRKCREDLHIRDDDFRDRRRK